MCVLSSLLPFWHCVFPCWEEVIIAIIIHKTIHLQINKGGLCILLHHSHISESIFNPE